MLQRDRSRRCFPVLVIGAAASCAPSVPHFSAATRDAAADVRSAADVHSAADVRPVLPDVPSPIADASSEPLVLAATDAPGDSGAADSATDASADLAVLADAGRDAVVEAFTYDGAPPVPPRAGEVVIDELLVNPAGSDTNREWIEIANTTDLALDLRQLHVADAAKDVAVDAGLLSPQGILVLGQSLDPGKNGGAPVAVAYGSAISLNNDGDSIAICLGPCASGQVLDRVAWDKDLGPAYDGHAAMVTPGSGAFCPATEPFGDGSSFGSPGAPNLGCRE